MAQQPIAGFRGKNELVAEFVRGRNVLHLGAVGETCEDTEQRVRRAEHSLHAMVTAEAKQCLGVDYDEPSVRLLTERGIFDNLLCADATKLTRADITLPSVDVVLAGDIIEHLTEPGLLLDMIDNVAEPDSVLVISTLNALGLAHGLRNLRGRPLEEGDHVCSFTANTFAHMIQRKGWRVEQMWTCHQPIAEELNPRVFRVAKRLFGAMPQLGGTLLAVCRR